MAEASPQPEPPKQEAEAPAPAPAEAPAPAPAGGEEDDNAPAPEEEANVEFTPLVKLDEVKTTTGEDEEEVLFKMRAKLFRWESDSWEKEVKLWKERGTGDVRFLQHKETKKVRLLMRREKTMKICANFFVVPTISLAENAGSDRSWVWQCHDYSEGRDGTTETQYSTLAIRFANSENAQKFKEEFEKAKEANKAAGMSGEATGAAPAAAAPEEAPAKEAAPAADAKE
ncbi:hypothetical protein EMIHUDRAFT_452973 [Emiliania huxleyi CCMP1516]|jgi:Ran-binding protein 1|uniref:RanBD1 domain-containing protein n=4 Tax=Eukaryota TaxID=2759 RepID=A0A0D3IBN5_EMIH1|nr:hypothetical protein EMIHUDRAFT_453068 [Emiliania huxleyi CCMP1516]XP_005761186.1 hypothetical protein EMIHUDRAFT_452973 [Emiliania huxleyi CCMP1516]EOD08670.1 hypothetical protein EMIHUDRAFT_453068 [Emiliania huxleyi CCMP1516]EOD08757.1 hypothetical protein EMIHUDRAFT_452973 [Emiliania huxleyi CCMP1516]|eukprot:XP_005761099.1 hypothetical protein EMIHUDRAFT_453068 [Emiliania huxleyi CCMP1516]